MEFNSLRVELGLWHFVKSYLELPAVQWALRFFALEPRGPCPWTTPWKHPSLEAKCHLLVKAKIKAQITELVWLQILASAWQREYSVCNFSDIGTFKRFCIYWTPELGNVRQPPPLGLHDASIMCKMKPKLDIPFAQNLLSCRVSS